MSHLLRIFLSCIGALVVVAASADHASAHSGVQSYVYVNIHDDGMDGRIEYPAADLGQVLGVEFPSDVDGLRRVVDDNLATIQAYTDEHLAIGVGGVEWDLDFDGADVLGASGGYVQIPFTVEQSFDSAPRSFDVTYDGIIHADPRRDALFIIENDFGTATFNNEAGHLVGFSTGLETQRIELDTASAVSSALAVRGLGTDAVRAGIDHLLFVVAMILPVGLLAVGHGINGPAPTVTASAGRLARVVVTFVVTHSIVLWVIGLGGFEPPDRLVTTLVALSLLVMAVYAAWQFTSAELVVVGVLGAVQGLGLGLQFVDAQLDRSSPVVSLIGFNLGIEAAVLIVVALVFPVLLLVRRTVVAPIALYGGAVVIGGYAVSWLIERIGDTDLDVGAYANPLRVWPRNFWLMLVVIAGAGALYAWTASRHRLRPLAAESGEGDAADPDRAMVHS